MKYISHRGLHNKENTLHGIIESFRSYDMVEIDIHYNLRDTIVLCHDRNKCDDDNVDTFEDLCNIKKPMHLLVDIKAVGFCRISSFTTSIIHIISKYPHHTYELCSFNEFCVSKLDDLRKLYNLNYKLGIISSGIPLLHEDLKGIDFISLNKELVDKCVIEYFHGNNMKVYVWVCNTKSMRKECIHMLVDGIIMDDKQSVDMF